MQEGIQPPSGTSKSQQVAPPPTTNSQAAADAQKILIEIQILTAIQVGLKKAQKGQVSAARTSKPSISGTAKNTIKFLEKELALLEKNDPGNPEIAKLKKALAQLAKKGPNFSQKDLTELLTLYKAADAIAKQTLKGKAAAQYKANEVAFLKSVNYPPDLKADAQKALANTGSSESLADQFAKTVLDKYMVGQEKYLMQLAMLFAAFNMGAEAGNVLMGVVSGWGNAGTEFQGNNWLASNFGNSTYGEAKKKLGQEIANAKKYESQDKELLKKLEAELKKVNAKISQIEQEVKDGKISKAEGQKLIKQYTKLGNQLANDWQNANTTLGSLKKLVSTLETMTQNLVSEDGGKKWHINGWGKLSPQLSKEENAVVNGDPSNKKYPGGLQKIYTDISSDQTGWQNLSQTEQITLQMRMTQIQQEWTVVATALQILFGSYKTIASGIYR